MKKLWSKIKLFFGICPIDNIPLLHWSFGVWKCTGKCMKTYYG